MQVTKYIHRFSFDHVISKKVIEWRHNFFTLLCFNTINWFVWYLSVCLIWFEIPRREKKGETSFWMWRWHLLWEKESNPLDKEEKDVKKKKNKCDSIKRVEFEWCIASKTIQLYFFFLLFFFFLLLLLLLWWWCWWWILIVVTEGLQMDIDRTKDIFVMNKCAIQNTTRTNK